MSGNMRLIKITFAYKQISPLGEIEQCRSPFGISGVGNHFLLRLDPDPMRISSLGMDDRQGEESEIRKFKWFGGFKGNKAYLQFLHNACSGIEQTKERMNFLTQAFGTDNRQDLRTLTNPRIEQKIGQTTVMVAVKMRDNDIVNLILVDRMLFQAGKSTSPQVDQHTRTINR